MKHETVFENTFPLQKRGNGNAKKFWRLVNTYSEIGLKKPLFLAKFVENDPHGLQTMLEGWKIDLQTGFSIDDHFSWALGVH